MSELCDQFFQLVTALINMPANVDDGHTNSDPRREEQHPEDSLVHYAPLTLAFISSEASAIRANFIELVGASQEPLFFLRPTFLPNGKSETF
jgi:hypothetical protein